MAIVFHCECGRPLRASPETAGKKTKCPGCGHVLTIPSAQAKPTGPALEIEEDPFAPSLDWSTLNVLKAAPKDPDSESSLSTATATVSTIKIDAAQADEAHAEDIPRTEDGTKQYRVLGHKEQGVVGKFTPGRLEEVLNAHARNGWSLKAAVVIDMPGHSGHHDELVLILER